MDKDSFGEATAEEATNGSDAGGGVPEEEESPPPRQHQPQPPAKLNDSFYDSDEDTILTQACGMLTDTFYFRRIIMPFLLAPGLNRK